MDAEMGEMCFEEEDGPPAQGQTGSHWKLTKARKRSSPQSLQKDAALTTLTLAQ